MDIPTYTPYILRQKLSNYLDFLLRKTHIECLMTLRQYKIKLEIDECLTKEELDLIFKFYVRDSDRSVKELRQIFQPITQSNQTAETTPTLEYFFS
jgi:hypothetical protein